MCGGDPRRHPVSQTAKQFGEIVLLYVNFEDSKPTNVFDSVKFSYPRITVDAAAPFVVSDHITVEKLFGVMPKCCVLGRAAHR